VGADERNHARIIAEAADAWATGDHQRVEILPGRNGRERQVRVQGDAAATGDVDAGGECCHDDLDSGASEHVDRSDGLDFLESLRKEQQDTGHGGGCGGARGRAT
jgi:hypothetical protein